MIRIYSRNNLHVVGFHQLEKSTSWLFFNDVCIFIPLAVCMKNVAKVKNNIYKPFSHSKAI